MTELASFDKGESQAGNRDIVPAGRQAMVTVEVGRVAQEVQGQITAAKLCPRDIFQSEKRILEACRRPGLAEAAFYTYQKGGTQVSGSSIRMAEMMAQNWGNMESGVKEIEQRGDETLMMSYAWDFETNTRDVKTFTVKHEMKSKNAPGGIRKLTDQRDIYEHCANLGARRKRACILALIPGDLQERAVEECKKTLAGQSDEPLIDRVRKMVRAFEEFGVTVDHIIERLGHNLEATDEAEFVTLRGIYSSLRDGMSKRDNWFNITGDTDDGNTDNLKPGKKKTAKQSRGALAKTKKKAAEAAPDPPAEKPVEQDEKLFDAALENPDDPATPADLGQLRGRTYTRLCSCGLTADDENINKLIGFAAMGTLLSAKEPTRQHAHELITLVANLTDADVNIAIKAD